MINLLSVKAKEHASIIDKSQIFVSKLPKVKKLIFKCLYLLKWVVMHTLIKTEVLVYSDIRIVSKRLWIRVKRRDGPA